MGNPLHTGPLLAKLFELVQGTSPADLGHYDQERQTRSHRVSTLVSPVTHN